MFMQHAIKTVEDLRWLMAHTGGFRSGYVTDMQMSKRRLFDEESGRDVLADPRGTLGKLALGAALAAGTGGLGLGVWSALREPVTNTVEKIIPGVNTGVEAGETILE